MSHSRTIETTRGTYTVKLYPQSEVVQFRFDPKRLEENSEQAFLENSGRREKSDSQGEADGTEILPTMIAIGIKGFASLRAHNVELRATGPTHFSTQVELNPVSEWELGFLCEVVIQEAAGTQYVIHFHEQEPIELDTEIIIP